MRTAAISLLLATLLFPGDAAGAGAAGGVSGARTKIAFSSRHGGNSDIYVMNPDGSGVRRLTRNPAEDTAPAWSPDGRRIAFVSGRAGDGVYVMSADGSGQRRLMDDGYFPAWSPDGRKIAFLSDRGGTYDIYSMNAEGGGVRNLTRNPAEYQSVGRPAWSPDGRKIAFDRQRLTGDEGIYVMNADGSRQRRLTRNATIYRGLAWSPDGRKIAFASDRRGNFDIYVMNSDGSGVRRLTGNPVQDTAPAWSPDGRKIAFASGYLITAIYVINADGSGAHRVMKNADEAAWQPVT